MALKAYKRGVLNLLDKDFRDHKFEYYAYLRDHQPVAQMRIAFMKVVGVARYDDCLALVKDSRFGRNRARITGGSRMPFPLPKNLALLAQSMIVEDDPEHRRLRQLVQKAFAPKSLADLDGWVVNMTHELLDEAISRSGEPGAVIDLQRDYALKIPTAVIARMVGIDQQDMPRFQSSLSILTQGLSGWSVLRTVAWDLGKTIRFVRELIAAKRKAPAQDILSALIEAEEDGDRLSEDEIVSLVFLLIIAGYETTVHLISNGVVALLSHPEQLQRVRETPELMGSAVEEMLRYCGPIHGTKMNYAAQDLEIAGVPISKGTPVVPLLGSANRDERVFSDPDRFDISRDPNRHLAFSQGNHFCLGAFLARMEARIAIASLLERCPDLALAVPREQLKIQSLPLWHRYNDVPLRLAQ